jgi:hypothetical protein
LGLRFWSFFLLLVCLCTRYSDPNCISKAYCSYESFLYPRNRFCAWKYPLAFPQT